MSGFGFDELSGDAEEGVATDLVVPRLGQVVEDSWDDDSNGGKLPTSVLASSIRARRETAAVLIPWTGRPR